MIEIHSLQESQLPQELRARKKYRVNADTERINEISNSIPDTIDAMKKVLRIAVADRSVLCRKIAKKLLTKMCHSVFATDNADSLIAVIKQSLILATHDHSNLFDVILLASNLNGTCDAYQTCQYIRQLGFKGILCALTALPTSALSHFIDCGATNALLKPLMKEQFICLCKGNFT